MSVPENTPGAAPDAYRCQFCDREAPALEWKQEGRECPACGRLYDPMLAQEGDD